jgi:hypothetical protein
VFVCLGFSKQFFHQNDILMEKRRLEDKRA